MKIITNIQEANDLLQSFSDAHMQIVSYTDSLKRIAIRLKVKKSEEVIYLVGIGCESINGYFDHSNVNLAIELSVNREANEEVTKIFDRSLPFELITSGGFSMVIGRIDNFGQPFYNFFKDEKK